MPVYHIYRLTCSYPSSPHKYYYGYRSCAGNSRQDNYWSSSKAVRAAIATYGFAAFAKKVVAVYPKEAALAREIRLHRHFQVARNPCFFNKSNQTTTKFTTSGCPVSPAHRAKIARAATARPPQCAPAFPRNG